MFKSTRVWFATLLVALVGALALFTVHYASFGWRQCHPQRSLVTKEERSQAKLALPKLEEVEFKGEGGVPLRGWFAPPQSGALVILVPGLGGNRASLLPEAELMARAGYGIFSWDARASGESGGSVATWGVLEALDIAQGIRFARARPEVKRIALLGFSVGASAVTRAAANDPSVSPVVLYATWPNLRDEIRYKTAKGGPFAAAAALLGFRLSGTDVDAIRPESDMARIAPRPVLLVSGLDDWDTPPAIMDRMFALTSPPKQIWKVPHVGHGGYEEAAPAAYQQHVLGFLDQYLRR
ncbi:MAG: alpha/beta fold hydrolase [Pseudomonadota bacterium]